MTPTATHRIATKRVTGVVLGCVAFAGILCILTSCSRQPTDSDGLYKVMGTVYHAGQPLVGATVSLDDAMNYTTETNQEGYFQISNVVEGNHEIRFSKSFDNGSFTTRTEDIIVVSDVDLSSLILPKAVVLYEITTITYSSATLSWSATDASDFREYKLYRHTTSGLDETTGLLTHVSTTIDDTTFVDENLLPAQEYFYRVYVMNEYGRMGGSNLVSTATDNHNVVKNGDFEIFSPTTYRPTDWEVWLSAGPVPFFVDNANPQSGDYCLKAGLTAANNYDNFFFQYYELGELIAGRTYRFSYWLRTDTLYNNQNMWLSLADEDWDNRLFNGRAVQGPVSILQWQEYEIEFNVPEVDPTPAYRLLFNFWVEQQDMTIWMDNISLISIN